MPDNSKKKILIIANARMPGGLSGGDAIYESFTKYWPNCEFEVDTMMDIDFKPASLCYLYKICLGIFRAVTDRRKFDFVYSASDFLMDSVAGWAYKLRGHKWVAGFFLLAFIENKKHYYTQKIAYKLIQDKADMVVITNPTMEYLFPNKQTTWINGGIELKNAGLSNEPKVYDAVFCGRLHFTKGILELLKAWQIVKFQRPESRLAIIGDGDMGRDTIRSRIRNMRWPGNGGSGITMLGFMGDERYDIYKKSKIVLYPTPPLWDHFSMAPVEAMACGCPMVTYGTAVQNYFRRHLGMKGALFAGDFPDLETAYANAIIHTLDQWEDHIFDARDWAIKFDYQFQSKRVYNQIMGVMFNESIGNRFRWDAGDSNETSPHGSRTDLS